MMQQPEQWQAIPAKDQAERLGLLDLAQNVKVEFTGTEFRITGTDPAGRRVRLTVIPASVLGLNGNMVTMVQQLNVNGYVAVESS